MAFTGVQKLSSGFRVWCDRSQSAFPTGYSSAGLKLLSGLVDVDDGLSRPGQSKTKQISAGLTETLPGLRTGMWTFTFHWDWSTDAAVVTHAMLVIDARMGNKNVYQLDYPPAPPVSPAITGLYKPAGTGMPYIRQKAVIADLNIPSVVGNIIVATLTLQRCGRSVEANHTGENAD
jgi:hypothetical protein